MGHPCLPVTVRPCALHLCTEDAFQFLQPALHPGNSTGAFSFIPPSLCASTGAQQVARATRVPSRSEPCSIHNNSTSKRRRGFPTADYWLAEGRFHLEAGATVALLREMGSRSSGGDKSFRRPGASRTGRPSHPSHLIRSPQASHEHGTALVRSLPPTRPANFPCSVSSLSRRGIGVRSCAASMTALFRVGDGPNDGSSETGMHRPGLGPALRARMY